MKLWMLYSALFIFFLPCIIIPQEGTPPPEPIKIGALINYYNSDIIFSGYYKYKDLGINSSLSRVITGPGLSNMDSLKIFDYIAALNDSIPLNAVYGESIDWIYYFSNALYSKWEAEGDTIFEPGIYNKVGVTHNSIGYATSDGWCSGDNLNDIGKAFIDGPNYTQYMKYVYTNKYNNNPIIQYRAAFRIKLADPQELTFDAVKLKVVIKDIRDGSEVTLDSLILSTTDLSTSYQTKNLSYNYNGFFDQTSQNVTPPPPGLSWIPFTSGIEGADTSFINFNKKIQFRVERLGEAVVTVDKIEVYDYDQNGIWENYFQYDYETLVNKIIDYNSTFSPLGNKLKYYHTIDEPHSFDCYYPIRKVQEILDSLQINRDLFVHFYPGWNNYRDSTSILDKWQKLAKPTKLMFWYAPFTQSEDGISEDRYFTLNALRANLQEAHLQQPDFWLTLQSWGTKNTTTNQYKIYEYPDTNELLAGTMLALAHGIKGILYESYYSYKGWTPDQTEEVIVECLVNLPDSGYAPKLNWYIVQKIADRLKGNFGQELSRLAYSGNYLQLRYKNPGDNTNPVTFDFLTIGHPITPDSTVSWHAGFFTDSLFADNKYFMLTNVYPFGYRDIRLTATAPVTGFNNYRFTDVEGALDTTYGGNLTIDLTYPPGEGYLFQVAPVIKYGGTLIYNDTVKTSGTELKEDMTIKNGVTLSIKKDITYTVNDTITLEGTGFISGQGYIYLSEGTSTGTINTVSWSKSLFKGLSNGHPLLYIRKPSTESAPTTYTVYRKIGIGTFTSLGNLSGTAAEYIDSTVDISSGNPVIEYYVKAGFSGFSLTTNIVRYDRTDWHLDTLIIPTGWQTVSVPVIMTDSSKMAVLGTNTVYKYSGMYVPVDKLDNGIGYWASFSNPDTIVFNGTPIDTLAMPVDSGWNLKGSLGYNMFVSEVRPVPDTIILSIFKYENG